ncbi:hypothetical protein EJ076_29535 [Mesorhizobium sp. M7D.F.Ca.US.005.01.1.1]|uniref:hypothetical protein n=1 Tax=Mesorhizobium sp. M7D.F.Ca.US.005.01.1.1 TaxID=2493678 RepID=UPI000F76000E|nr:hypothetical protein [Mesorhizobium sp. M7D.F.Ca.US.005.01.1.1]AZO44950.1 hypothetical protein EJ076_29535 [Mesorhizobium sp. M7D.F.Ca.US.005.01.1.1]
MLPESRPASAAPQPYSPEWLNALTAEQRHSPDMTEFSRRMHNGGGEHVTWLHWSYEERQLWTPRLSRQGSVFFLDCGRRPFAVTAGHVFEQFVEDRKARRVRGCQIANVGFNPEDRLIAWGKELGVDIATFRVTPEEVAATGKKVVRGIDGPWPQPPNIGELVYFGGFPGVERDVIAPDEISLGLHSAMVGLTSFTDYQLCCQFDRNYWVDVRGLGLPPVGYELGGISGGPMIQPIFNNGVWDWRLVGAISEAIMAEDFERITAVRAHFILPDGRLSR